MMTDQLNGYTFSISINFNMASLRYSINRADCWHNNCRVSPNDFDPFSNMDRDYDEYEN